MPDGGYDIGVSSGWFSIAKAQELLGLAQKTASIATYGVNYVQVDFENTSEFFEPDVIERLRQVVDDLQIKWGAHGEIGEFMGWEGAIEVIWKQSHRRLHQYLDGLYDFFIKGRGHGQVQTKGKSYEKYKPQYINFHASNMPPIGLFVERYRYSGHAMLDFNGRENWDDLFKENKELYEWFLDEMVLHLFAREAGIAFFDEAGVIQQAIHRILNEKINKGEINFDVDKPKEADGEEKKQKMDALVDNITEQNRRKKIIDDIQEDYENKYKQGDKEVRRKIHETLYQMWLETSRLKNIAGAISVEEWAYAIVAKYLEFKKGSSDEPLWNMFFGNKSMKELEESWTTEQKIIKLFDPKRGVVNLMPEVVAMVACRYIIGHFGQKLLPEFIQERKLRYQRENIDWDPFYELTAREKLEKIGVVFAFETPEIIENQREGLQRIIHARDIYRLVKTFKSKYVRGLFDSEHYIHNGFDPIDEIRSCPDDMGKYFIGFHVGAPKPYHPVHEPIDVGSEAQRWIYIYAYEMRKKGFGVEDKALIIFERGGARGGQSPINFIGQSALALRHIVEELNKNTRPENLPISFFGVSPEGMQSVEKQVAMMREHYWDPLKGMLSVPEEDYTFFSRAAIEKGKKPEEFKKEELR